MLHYASLSPHNIFLPRPFMTLADLLLVVYATDMHAPQLNTFPQACIFMNLCIDVSLLHLVFVKSCTERLSGSVSAATTG